MATHHLTLIVREGCHLCDDMRDALRAFAADLDFDWQEVDVDADAELLARYNVDVPVLMHAGEAICHHFLDSVALRSALAGAGPQAPPR